MLNIQVPMINECSNAQSANVLSIEHCSLNITTQEGVV